MKLRGFLLTFLLGTALMAWAQNPASAPQSSSGTQAGGAQTTTRETRAARRAQMEAMCKAHLETMKSDVQRMHSAFDRMKSNVATITNADEKARWQANLDMWETVVNHHDQMLKHMDAAQASGMGCDMMMGEMGMGGMMGHHHGMGEMNPAPAPQPAPKPQ